MQMQKIKEMFCEIYEKTKKLDIAINAVLVSCEVRPAFLVQSIDYNEQENGPITSNILSCLEKYFSINKTHNGFLVSETKIEKTDEMTDEKIGEMIGYPCAGHLNYEEKRNFCYTVYAANDTEKVELLAVICDSNNDNWFMQFALIANDVMEKLFIDVDVYYRCRNIIKKQQLIEIIKNKTKDEFDEREKTQILNLFWNYYPIIYDLYDKNFINIFDSTGLEILIENCDTVKHEMASKTYQEFALKTYFNPIKN